jgi:hypothetical protein
MTEAEMRRALGVLLLLFEDALAERGYVDPSDARWGLERAGLLWSGGGLTQFAKACRIEAMKGTLAENRPPPASWCWSILGRRREGVGCHG